MESGYSKMILALPKHASLVKYKSKKAFLDLHVLNDSSLLPYIDLDQKENLKNLKGAFFLH